MGNNFGFYFISTANTLGAAIVVTIFSLVKKRTIKRRGGIAMVVLCGVAIATYVLERVLHIEYDFSPVANVLLMIGALIPVYKSNLYTVYEKKGYYS